MWRVCSKRHTLGPGHPSLPTCPLLLRCNVWSKVVGVDGVCVSDHTLFCVLEWGGMEAVQLSVGCVSNSTSVVYFVT